ncbi:NUDIX domain protein [Aquimixticola soesokkakensis]|uniref:NUDIX domain protein n=1 Tax=Aquimixticola soesokkakensis TaxID=1519096 RepID=A0A1Y5SZS1_9RHOB|nr:NUDIX hydrolase [Aquimixticola soesokkakensis]SLN50342.1 NUDIX domain protein [Aquimixticola soesokkakensis]
MSLMPPPLQSPRRTTPRTAHTKRDVRTQFGALIWRIKDGKVQVMLVTSRGQKRWIIPKGWPMKDETPARAAAIEAWEEAGVAGKTAQICVGLYSYVKDIDDKHALPCMVAIFPLKAGRLATHFPEEGQRKRKWFSVKKAASKVAEPELAQIIARFDPARLGLK